MVENRREDPPERPASVIQGRWPGRNNVPARSKRTDAPPSPALLAGAPRVLFPGIDRPSGRLCTEGVYVHSLKMLLSQQLPQQAFVLQKGESSGRPCTYGVHVDPEYPRIPLKVPSLSAPAPRVRVAGDYSARNNRRSTGWRRIFQSEVLGAGGKGRDSVPFGGFVRVHPGIARPSGSMILSSSGVPVAGAVPPTSLGKCPLQKNR